MEREISAKDMIADSGDFPPNPGKVPIRIGHTRQS
jgi:hypothetical protein